MIIYQELAKYGKSVFEKVVTQKPEWIHEIKNYDPIKKVRENKQDFFTTEEEQIISDVNLGIIEFYDREFYDEVCVKLFVYIASGKKKEIDLIDIIALPYLKFLLILGKAAWNEAYSLQSFDVNELYQMWKCKNVPEFFKRHLKEGQI